MDLEQFPSSKAGQRMLDSVSSGFYDRSYVGKWIFQVMGLEMDEAKRIVEELQEQAFPETATWGLMYHEMKYGLPVIENLSYEERRRFIYQKRDARSPMNSYRMEVILERITGRKAHVDDESGPVNTFTVTIESGSDAVDVSTAISKLKAIKQSHVTFTARFAAIARIELCENVELYRSRYVQCGTVPGISTGLKILDGKLNIMPETAAYKKFHPMSGHSGETGQYPKISTGEKQTGKSVVPEVNTESYQVRYPLCGNSFEI